MTRLPLVAKRVEELLGSSVIATAPVAGGEISTTTRVRLSNGMTALVKTHHQAAEGFFDAEARGLTWLAEARRDGGVAVPEVLAHDHECLVLRWVEPGKNTVDAATNLGQALARTHRFGADAFGAEEDGFIGRLPMPNRTAPTWPEFYATRRILPYLKLARDRGAATEDEGAAIEGVLRRLSDLIPEEPPARLHGDLWNGNVLWGLDGACRVIDPAAYGGHREVDLAMLALFGLPHLHRVLDAYEEEHPLADGWRDRLGLHQLFPLLVHACHFGGGYGARAAETARAFS
ncbi:MAG: fructosamine kinase family protein [Nocardioides sp.]